MEAGFDHVLFTTDKQLENELTFGTLNLVTDPSFDPHKNSRTYGTVLALPRGFSDIVISGPVPPYSYIKDIAPEVEVGDKIYFHFNTLAYEDSEIARTKDKEPIYPIRYDQIYCSVRQGKIIPIGGWTLITPIPFESNGNIFDPHAPKHFPRIGTLAHIGTPLKGHKPNSPVNPGEAVLIRKNADRIITVEGKEFYITHQKNIFGSASLELLKTIVKNE